jgi:hypothetical protein
MPRYPKEAVDYDGAPVVLLKGERFEQRTWSGTRGLYQGLRSDLPITENHQPGLHID